MRITAQVQLDAYLVPLFAAISGRGIYSLGLGVRRSVPIEHGVTVFEGNIARLTAALLEISYYAGSI